MIITPKKTTVAYRCNVCGAMVLTELDLFKLSSVPAISCSCGESSMRIQLSGDDKVRLTAPCMFCPNPHQYTLAGKSFFDRELFVLDCPYTGVDIVVMGQQAKVINEVDRANRELGEYAAEAEALSREYEIYQEALDEKPMEEVLRELVAHLCEDGRIKCECNGEGCYKCTVDSEESLRIYCLDCGGSFTKQVDSPEELANWFADGGPIRLEP